MSVEQCERTVSLMKQVLTFLDNGKVNVQCVNKWMKCGTRSLRILGQLLRKEGTTVSEKQRYLATIAQLKGVNLLLKASLTTGGGLQKREKRSNRVSWCDLESAFKERVRSGVIVNLKHVDTMAFLKDAVTMFETRVKNALKKENSLKINTVLAAEYSVLRNNEKIIEVKYFNTKNVPILQTTDLKNWFLRNVQDPILKDMEEFQERDSGWTLHSIVNLTINFNKYNPMRGSSYIDIPGIIKRKQACVNVRNFDNECFKWALLSALHPVDRRDHPERVSKYIPYENELNFDGIEFPVAPRQIKKFEKQNDLSVNTYILEKRSKKYNVMPIHITSQKKDKHVNLLMIQNYYVDDTTDAENVSDEDQLPIRYHYVCIKDLSRLVCKQLSNKKIKKYICDRCLHYFYSAEKLSAHELDCTQINECKVVLPSIDQNSLKFKNFNNKEKVPFIVYGDFECLLKSVQSDKNSRSNTEVHQIHEPFSMGYYFRCSYDDTLSYYRSYRGENPAEWFVRELLQLAEDIETVFWCPLPMDPLTPEQERDFNKSTQCHMCEKPLFKKRVRDHCHLTGKYRGPAHEDCNLNYQDSRTIPIVFHNLTGYDSHLIIKDISTYFEGRIDIVPRNKERYISFTKSIEDCDIKFRLIDSYQFMASSLDKLASNLQKLPIVRSEFADIDNEKFQLLTRKGVFPYEYLDAWEKLISSELPSKEEFYSGLNQNGISDKDYKHAQGVWKAFNIQDLGEYSDLYLKTDVLLLADVFEQFRDSCLKAYGLDPAHYYTAPGLTWDAMLKWTKIELELLTDIDMLLFIERGIRGGMSQCSNRYAKANNKFMATYNPGEESKYLMYYDVNNLYGWAMTQHLPYDGFVWLEDVGTFDFNVPDDSPIGYILEVDLEYPETIHDIHSDLPLCPEHKKPPGSKQAKLLTTLFPKSRYVIHYRNLKQAVNNGLRLTKIHRVLKFNQSPWLKSYIDLNSGMRQQANSAFEKDLYKLMNNAVFGKTMENVRKRVDVKLLTKWEGRYGAEARIARPNFHSRSIFSENLVAVELNKTQVVMNKPIYVGFCVLDLSKICVYDFHYGYMKQVFNENCKLLYTDTDSLVYEVKCPDIYEIMKRDIQKFDTSDYSPENVFSMPQCNKKVVGLMKDECNGKIMTEFVGLRSKMYSVRVEDKDRIKKAKGVKTNVVQCTIDFDDYVDCLRNMSTIQRTQQTFQSKLHVIQTIKQVK